MTCLRYWFEFAALLGQLQKLLILMVHDAEGVQRAENGGAALQQSSSLGEGFVADGRKAMFADDGGGQGLGYWIV